MPSLWITVKINVVEDLVFVYSPSSDTLNWVKSTIEKSSTIGTAKTKFLPSDNLLVQDLCDHENAIDIADFLVKKLLENGWVHLNFDKYEEGNSFHKLVSY